MFPAALFERARTSGAPPLSLLWGEAQAAAGLRRRFGIVRPDIRRRAARNAPPVLVLPGFLASDASTNALRHVLGAAGYRAYGWGMGRNLGVKPDVLDALDRRVADIAGNGPVILVGWSLGGLIAREYAKRQPDRIDRVITLGSPFSGDPRANHAWRLYELIARHKVDNPPIAARLTEKPPVPTYAIWSRRDGIVAQDCARGRPEESDRAIEVDCTHLGMVIEPCAIEAVFDALED